LQPRDALGRNLTYGLLDSLGRRIVTGNYDRRPFPTEAQLAEEYAVSRSVTREAVKMLTAKGLLSARPRQGTIVLPRSSWNLFDADVLNWLLERKFSIDLLLQFTDLRAAIEPAAADLAATRANAAAIAVIAAGFKRMRDAARGEDDPLESDIEFHVAVLQASGNPFFAQFKDVVSTALQTSIRFTNKIAGHTADLPAHEAVFEAIAEGDAPRARRAMDDLIALTRRLIVKPSARAGRRASGSRRTSASTSRAAPSKLQRQRR
jgi:DNA-binding FadR family transcriptional regulator